MTLPHEAPFLESPKRSTQGTRPHAGGREEAYAGGERPGSVGVEAAGTTVGVDGSIRPASARTGSIGPIRSTREADGLDVHALQCVGDLRWQARSSWRTGLTIRSSA